jgi:hypothetical protein
LLQAAQVPHWLFGGWAIDFHVGAITRPHDDIEFLVWHTDAVTITSILAQHQYERFTGGYGDEMGILFKHQQKLEFDYLSHDHEGRVVVTGRWSDWPWPHGAFDAPPVTFAGITCPIISVAGLLAIKQGYAQHPAGGPLRPKDVADIQHLHVLLAS